MILVTALYPNAPGSRFDAAYYVGPHTDFARGLLEPEGLVSIRTTIGIAALDGAPPPFWSISEMVFTSRDAFAAAITAKGDALFADVPNYTDVTPILQVSVLHEDAR